MTGAERPSMSGPAPGATALERFRMVASDPRAEIRALKRTTGRPVVGYVDVYLPEEVLLAHGALPYRVVVDGSDEARATERIQSYACPAARNILGQALRGDLGFLDGILFTRYCDSLRGVFSVWESKRLTPYIDLVGYPTVTTTEAAVSYLAAELREVSVRLGEALGAPADERLLRRAIVACNRKRGLVADLAARRAHRTLPVMGADYLAVLVAATTMATEECVAALENLLGRPPLGEPGDAVPVVLSGVTFDNVALARAIESTGLFIVGDDLATGSRWWTVHVDEEAPDLWPALARAYLTKPPCSVKEPSAPRADHLLAQVRACAAAGVLFYLTRFCDSEEAEWPYLRDRLAEAGVPSMVIEGEQRNSGFEQLRTRLEAFREQLEEGMGEWA